MITDPTMRYNLISELASESFSTTQTLKDWDVKVDQNYVKVEAK